MKQQGAHDHDVACPNATWNEVRQGESAHLIVDDDASGVATGQDTQCTTIRIAGVEMDSDGQELRKCARAWLCYSDAACDATPTAVVNMDRQDAVLMGRNRPVRGRSLVEERRVDRKRMRPKVCSSNAIDARGRQFGAEVRNLLEEMASSEHRSRRVS